MKKIAVLLILSISLALGCKKNKQAVPDPDKAILKFPCTSGTIISDSQSSITFLWTPSAHTSSYEVFLKNLLSGQISQYPATTNELTITIARNTPYSWYVISKSDINVSTAQSETWKFYNSGVATISHPPFPADAIKPAFGQNVSASANMIDISWTGIDADNDILAYDVYFGTASAPLIWKSNISSSFLNNIPVISGTTYYWKIVTKDSQGNSSESAVFQFKVN